MDLLAHTPEIRFEWSSRPPYPTTNLRFPTVSPLILAVTLLVGRLHTWVDPADTSRQGPRRRLPSRGDRTVAPGVCGVFVAPPPR